jgi:AcrR family transcriptional regulator
MPLGNIPDIRWLTAMDRSKEMPTKTRGPYAKTPARRATIIAAAREAFIEHGYDNASLRDIAKRAGITHQGLLRHFRGKPELLLEVLRQRDTTARARAGDLLAAGTSAAATASRILQEELRDPGMLQLWATLQPAAARPDHPAHEYFLERQRHWVALIAQEMRDRELAGHLTPGLDATTAATLLLAGLGGLQLQALLDPDLDVDHAVRSLFAALMSGAPPDHQGIGSAD